MEARRMGATRVCWVGAKEDAVTVVVGGRASTGAAETKAIRMEVALEMCESEEVLVLRWCVQVDIPTTTAGVRLSRQGTIDCECSLWLTE